MLKFSKKEEQHFTSQIWNVVNDSTIRKGSYTVERYDNTTALNNHTKVNNISFEGFKKLLDVKIR